MKLTAANVAKLALPLGKVEVFFWDDDVPGFGCRLRDAGRTFVFQYRFGRRQRRLTIGSTSAISASDARATASKLYAQVRLGADPADEKKRSRAAVAQDVDTFEVAINIYLARQAQRLRPRSFVEVERHLLQHAKSLHRMPLAEIGRRDIAKLVASLSNTSGPVAANRTCASLAAFFAYCVRDGWVDNNPAAFTNRLPEAPRSRVLTDDELRTIWKATEGGSDYAAAVRLLLLTGARREEIGGLLWSEIDIERATITLPPSRTKNARPHEIPLSAAALAILQAQPRREGRDYVFGETRRGFRSWSTGKALLDARAQISPGWVLHDLRRSVSTHLNGRLGVAPHVVEALLGHVGGQSTVARTYNRASYANEKRQAINLWAEHVAAIVEGREPKVVALVRA